MYPSPIPKHERKDSVAREKLIPQIKQKWCKACGLCFEYCPRKVFATDSLGKPYVARPDQCVTCYMCDYRCPDFAISFVPPAGEQ